jgi:hypothetical protein
MVLNADRAVGIAHTVSAPPHSIKLSNGGH